MSTPLRLLILEDRPADAELMLHELRQAGFEPDWQRVETKAHYLAQLRQDLDVILADYALPQFDALHALYLLQERGLDIPFIIVSGRISEEVAVECMKQGAADYLLKDRLARLGPAVAHALQEKKLRDEKRQAEAALRESEARFRRLAENVPDIIYRYRLIPAQGFEYLSPAVTAITGYIPEEYYTDPGLWIKLVHPDDRGMAQQLLLTGQIPSQPFVLRVIRKDGETIWMEQHGVSVYDEVGNLIAIEGIARDITSRKQVEEALRRAEQEKAVILGSMSELVAYQDLEMRILWANRAAGESVDLAPERLVGRCCYEMWHQRSEPCVGCPILKVRKTGQPQQAEITSPDGRVWFIRGYPVKDANGDIVGIVEVTLDITERKRAEEALQQHTAQLEALRQVGVEITAQLDLDSLLHSIVSQAIELLGGTSGGFYIYRPELDALEWTTATGPNLVPNGAILHRGEGLSGKVWETGQPLIVGNYQHWEGRAACYEGYPWTAVVGVPIRWGEELLGVVNVLADPPRIFSPADAELLSLFAIQAAIAIRNARLVHSLQDSEARYRAIVEDQTELVCRFLPNGTLTFVNEAYCRYFDKEHEELIGQDFMTLVPEKDHEKIEKHIASLNQENPIGTIEHCVITPIGGIRWQQRTDRAIFDGQGHLIGFQSVGRDITERKRAEKALKESLAQIKQAKQEWESTADSLTSLVCLLDHQGRIIRANRTVENWNLGRVVEVRGQRLHELLHPGCTDPACYLETFWLQAWEDLAQGRPAECEAEDKVLKRYLTVQVRPVSAQTDEESKKAASFAVAIAHDITERKRAEETMRIKDNAIASSINAMAIAEFAGDLTYVNPAFLKMWGYDDEKEVLGRHAVEFWQMEEKAWEVIETLRDGDSWIGELVARRNDGSLFDAQLSASTVTDETDEPIYMMASFMDITNRKRAEEQINAALREKEVLLKEIHHRVKNNLQIISSLLRLQSEYIQNEQMFKMFQESQNRVKSMALIHEKLYQSRDLAMIDFADYIRNLASYLFRSHGINSDAITLKINVDDVFLDIDTAVPCGLIINELVSNSLKHAFPRGREGEICIEFHSDKDDQFTLIVSDNGVGLPKDLDFRSTESLGLQLVKMLSQQLEGTVELDRSDGTTFKITFAELKKELTQ